MTVIAETKLDLLLEKEKISLSHFFESLDRASLEEVFHLMLACKGILFFTGVGKSGLIAEKIALTMTSTGTRALFLSPVNALHGDIGMVHEEDLFIAFSKSGESEELLRLVPPLRNRGVKTIAICGRKGSRLAKASDHVLVLPQEPEICPYDLAPTISTTMQLIVGDVLAVSLMQQKGFSLQEYAKSHPAGSIGKRITMIVSDLMLVHERLPKVLPHQKIVEILVELSAKQCGAVLVVDDQDRLLGIFTDGDLRRALQQHQSGALDLAMHEVMNPHPTVINPDVLAYEALKLMECDQKRPVTVLPVVKEGILVGLVKMHDLLQSGL